MKEIPECQIWEGVIEKGANWAEPDYEEFKKHIRKFVQSPTKIKKLAESNIQWLEENFSKNSVVNKWKDFFGNFIMENEGEAQQKEVSSYKTEKQIAVDKLKELVHPSERQKFYLKAREIH